MIHKLPPVTVLLFLCWSLNCAGNKTTATNTSPSFSFQEQILQTILGKEKLRHEDDIYYWPKANDPDAVDTTHLGTTINIDYLGERLSTVREDSGTHCVGMSWQVCISVLQDWPQTKKTNGVISGMEVDEMKDFADKWFVKLKGAPLAKPHEMGAVYALTFYKLGRQIPFKKARAGDFVQFWRKDNSGHSCIFLHWIYDKDGKIIGFKYWGSQPTTDGIGTGTEYFSMEKYALKPEKLVEKNRFYIGRLAPESD